MEEAGELLPFTQKAELSESAQKYLQSIASPRADHKPTAGQLWAYITSLYKNRGWKIDSDNELVIKLLCLYFSEDPRFEQKPKYGGSLKKGIILRGGYGTGKTWLMRDFAKVARQRFTMTTAVHLSETYANEGFIRLSRYYSLIPAGSLATESCPHLGLCIDEIGYEENPATHFKMSVNVIEHILRQRYTNAPCDRTHGTTNVNNEGLKKMYGDRIYSRLFEMFNIIDFPKNSKDRRVIT